MSTYRLAYNEKTSRYELHVDGCRHLMAAHLDAQGTREAESGKAAKAGIEADNEGILVHRLGPCTKAA